MSRQLGAGDQIVSYCTKCRLDLHHIIVAMVGERIAKVQCETCRGVHKFRDTQKSQKEPAAKRTRSSVKRGDRPDKTEALWETSIKEAKGMELPYDMAKSYSVGDTVVHAVFGRGVVQKVFFGTCAVLFKDKERILASSNS